MQYACNFTPPKPLPAGWTSHKFNASGKTVFMHSLSNHIMTLDRYEIFDFPIKHVTPNSGAGDKVSGYDTSTDDEDNVEGAITQVQMEELSLVDEFTTPKSERLAVASFLTLSRLQAIT
jgi:hypothetical protein